MSLWRKVLLFRSLLNGKEYTRENMSRDMKYPKRVESAIRVFHIFTTIYLALATKALITGRPARVVLVFLAFACVPEVYAALYRRRILKRGFANWKFKVLANSYFYYKNKRIECVLAAPYVSPYLDKMFEVILNDGEELPEVGSMIEICIPGDLEIHEAENRYIIGGYYELTSLEAN